MNVAYNGKLVSETEPRCYQVMIHKNQLLEKIQAGQSDIDLYMNMAYNGKLVRKLTPGATKP